MSGCSRRNKHGIEYVKAFTIYRTDSINDYNKGLGLNWFLFHDFNTDSSISRFPITTEPTVFKTYAGKLNSAYVDTLIKTMEFLRKFPNGTIQAKDSISMYSGPEFFMEFKDADGIHIYNFILEAPPLYEFSGFFFRVKELAWTKKEVNNNIINSDKEAVNAAVNLNFYNEVYPHYVSALCGDEINLNKLYGAWRRAGHRKTHTYNKEEFTKDGKYYYERIENDSSAYKFFATYTVDTQQNLIILKQAGTIKALRILKLTEECFEYEYLKEKFKIDHHRIR